MVTAKQSNFLNMRNVAVIGNIHSSKKVKPKEKYGTYFLKSENKAVITYMATKMKQISKMASYYIPEIQNTTQYTPGYA